MMKVRLVVKGDGLNMLTDIEISNKAKMLAIKDIAKKIGIN